MPVWERGSDALWAWAWVRQRLPLICISCHGWLLSEVYIHTPDAEHYHSSHAPTGDTLAAAGVRSTRVARDASGSDWSLSFSVTRTARPSISNWDLGLVNVKQMCCPFVRDA
jgi:hypothetical protein